MIPRRTFTAGALALAAAPLAAYAQQQGRLPRVVFLSTARPGDPTLQAILQALRDLGYTEGRTIAVEYFNAPIIADLPQVAARAVAGNPDVIVTLATPAPLAAKALTTTIPIVFHSVAAPIEVGLVPSLARPGGNVTGTVGLGTELGGKHLEILHEIIPGLSRVAVFMQPEDPISGISLPGIQAVGRILGIEIIVVEVREGRDFAAFFASASTNGAQAIQLVQTVYLLNNAARLAALAAQYRLPTMSASRRLPDAGGLVSYGPYLPEIYRRTAYLIDRILKGAKPADLPVEQPSRFEMVLNMKTAKALGLEIPLLVLAQADEIIE